MMQEQSVTLEQIRAAAQYLANRHNDTVAASAVLNAEIKAVIAPVLEKHQGVIDVYAAAEAAAQKTLENLLVEAPHLFAQPRSITVDGVRAGYKSTAESLDWDSDDALIDAIKKQLPKLAAVLIRTEESLVIGAVSNLSQEDRAKVGIRTLPATDQHYITVGMPDVAYLARIIIEDAMRRQGDDEKPKAPKGKAKAGKPKEDIATPA
jgi:hypothetical protein